MAVPAAELKKLQRQVNELQKLQRQVNELQKRVAQLEKKKAQPRSITHKPKRELSERERAIQLLRRAGITREMMPEEKQLAAEWRALSAEEKKEVEDSLRAVRLDPPLSQLVHEMRG
ncbi:MAG: hypothetical protein HY741_17365 [Chloroflexi bacterium]|nr:hypothetical protein [Chloroflexota bacterium]